MSLVAWTNLVSLEKPNSTVAAESIESATQILYLLSGRKFSGTQNVTEEYNIIRGSAEINTTAGSTAASSSFSDVYTDIYTEFYGETGSGNYAAGGSVGQGLYLRGRPVQQVTAITLGVAATPAPDASWQVLDKAYLRPRADASWRMNGIVSVTYQYGVDPPVAGYRAATVLANELIAAQEDCDNCRLPDRVTSINRGGVNMTILDPQTFFDKGKTGIFEIDMFLSAYNPHYAKARPRVFGPYVPRGKRVTS